VTDGGAGLCFHGIGFAPPGWVVMDCQIISINTHHILIDALVLRVIWLPGQMDHWQVDEHLS
jgi:hypothetical protein